MFILKSELTFPWPVKVIEPDPEVAGKLIEREFEVIFAILDPEVTKERLEERRAILAKITPETDVDELKVIQAELEAHDKKALQEIVRGWDKIVDADKKPIKFTDVTFREIYRYPRVKNALVRAYQEAVSEDKARLGN